jgi:fructokinase
MELSSRHPVVCFGEVLWDILPTGALPGGAPMNVAYHLKKLGTNPALITKVGPDDYGKKLVNINAESGLTTEFYYVDSEHQTGLVYANVNDQHEVVYDIVFPSAWDFIEAKEELDAVVSESKFFVFGSLTSRNKTSRETLYGLLEKADTNVLDINLRPPHFNRKHLEYLLNKAGVLKMNEAELELVTSWFRQFNSTEDRMKLVQEKFDIETLIVTLGGDGAVVMDNGKLYSHPGYKVTVADTIGSGDSFLAGFLHQTLRGAPVQQVLDFASAIGAFIATQKGGCPDYDVEQVNNLLNSNSSITFNNK